MTGMAELKPCPFCGKPVEIRWSDVTGCFVVYHNSILDRCVLHLPISIVGVGKMDAVDMWNRRAEDA